MEYQEDYIKDTILIYITFYRHCVLVQYIELIIFLKISLIILISNSRGVGSWQRSALSECSCFQTCDVSKSFLRVLIIEQKQKRVHGLIHLFPSLLRLFM